MVTSLSQWRWLLLFLCCVLTRGNGQATDVEVRLTAPNWVARGGSATLRCLHQVPPQLLYKVEFLRAGAKLLQYVRERNPPYTNYTFTGGKLNMSLATENSITIDNLDPSASGLYWCEVSLDTPIFTAASPPHQLTVVYSQKHPPIITFGKPDAVVAGLLRANCTSAPAAPPPRLTWYIDNVKVPEESIRYFQYRVSSLTRTKGGGGYRHRKHQHRYIAPEFNYTAKYWALVSESTPAPPASPTKHHKCTLRDSQSDEMSKMQERPRPAPITPISLWVSIAELRTPAHGKLQLTCTATIPGDVGPGEKFADVKKQTVTVPITPISLWVSIAELRTPAHGKLQLTCTATIPGDVGPGEKFADVKKQTVTVAVNELSLKKPHSETGESTSYTSLQNLHLLWLLNCFLILRN